MANFSSIIESVKSYRHNSLFIRNYFVILMFFVVLLSASSFAIYTAVYGVMEEEVSLIHENEVSRIKDIYEMLFTEVENLIARLGSDPDIEPFLQEKFGRFLNYQQIGIVQRIMRSIMISRFDFLQSIYLYSELNGTILSSLGETGSEQTFIDRDWISLYPEIKNGKRLIVLRDAYVGIYRSETKKVLSYFRRLPFSEYDERGGALVVNIDSDRLSALLATRSKTELIAIINEDGEILFSNAKADSADLNGIAEQLKRRDDFSENMQKAISFKLPSGNILTYQSGNYGKLLYVSMMKLEKYEQRFAFIRYVVIALAIASFVLAIGIAAFISVKVYNPIKDIVTVLKHPDADVSSEPKKSSEIKYIETNIARIVDDARRLKTELDESLELTKRAQFIALQSQINPHFLYNTLQAINWMAVGLTGEENEVSRSIITLSRLLMSGLRDSSPIVSLSEEIEHAELYIQIMKLRYRDQFDVSWDVPEELKNLKSLKLSLQPLLENSFYHGIKPLKKKGMVFVRAERLGNELTVEVRDTGQGLDEEKVSELNTALLSTQREGTERIGLRNINQRIKLIFGDEYGLSVGSGKSCGFSVLMRLPALGMGD
jgi:two-component system sensor histidine kinase YesM